jgi:hypothetical protein
MAIIFVTPEAADSPWLLFEAGVLFEKLGPGFVCPYLVDLVPSDLNGPLGHLQITEASKEDTGRLIRTINRALGERARPEKQLDDSFDMAWPYLESQLREIQQAGKPATPAPIAATAAISVSSSSAVTRLDSVIAAAEIDPALKVILIELKYTDWREHRWRKVSTLAAKARVKPEAAAALLQSVPEIVQLGESRDEERRLLARIWGISFPDGRGG